MDYVPLNDLRRGFLALEDELRPAVDAVLSSGWCVLGPEHDAFEREFAAAVGAEHCIGVGNGTDALELALLSVGCVPGDEVVTAANASMYTATAALKAGLVPRFADVDPDSLLLTAATVEPALTPRTKAVVVSTAGRRSTPSRSRGGATAGWTNCRRPCSASSFPTSTGGTRGGARSSPAMRRSSGAGRAAWSTAVPPAPRPTSVPSP